MFRLVLLLLLVPALASAQVAFTEGSRRTYDVASEPAGVALADFDRDGNVDFAVSERNTDSLAVFFGQGTGGMAGRVRYGTGDSPTAVATGDLNADGRADVAVANASSNTVTVYLGGPLGQLVRRLDYAVGLTPYGVTFGDANSDGFVDVVVANAGSNSVTILVGKGYDNGLNGSAITVPTGTGPRAVLVVDVNRDGINDLVTANMAADSMSVLQGLPSGGFAPRVDSPTLHQPLGLALGDLNADGWPDLALAQYGSSNVSVALNSNGSFPTRTDYTADTQVSSVGIGDFDGNGIPDLAVGHAGSSLVTFLPGNGNGTFGFRNSIGTDGPGHLAMAIGDVDNDGKWDVTVTSQVPPRLNLILNNGAGPFGPHVDYPAGTLPQGLVVTDLNGDARPDIAVANSGSSSLSTFMNLGDGNFGGKVDVPAPIGPTLRAADLNGDAKDDLILSTYRSFIDDTTRVSVYLNPGNGAFAARTDYDKGTAHSRMGVAVGDITHDGKLDLIVGHSFSTEAQILVGDGLGAFSTGPTLTVFNEPTWIDLADLDNNGWLDAVVGGSASFSSGLISVFKADGQGGFAPRVDYAMESRPVAITHADMNKDGLLDLLALNGGNAKGALWFNNGSATFVGPGNLVSPGAQGYSQVVGDVNQDGEIDVVTGRADNVAGLFYGRGGGVTSPQVWIPAANGLAGVALAPVDGNNTLDLITSNQDANSISVFHGRAKTRTVLNVTPNPSALGQSLTYSATVTKALPDSASPTGTVRFFDGVRLLGSAPLVGGVATLVQDGTAPWDRELSATYVGDGRFFGSISPRVPHTTYIPTVDVPAAAASVTLALAPLANPTRAGSAIRVRLALPGSAPARLSLIDVRGRVLETRAVHASGVVELAPRTYSGVYLVRVEQGGKIATARAVVL